MRFCIHFQNFRGHRPKLKRCRVFMQKSQHFKYFLQVSIFDRVNAWIKALTVKNNSFQENVSLLLKAIETNLILFGCEIVLSCNLKLIVPFQDTRGL